MENSHDNMWRFYSVLVLFFNPTRKACCWTAKSGFKIGGGVGLTGEVGVTAGFAALAAATWH